MKKFSGMTKLALASVIFAAAAGKAMAAYPDKPIKLVVPYPPGGASDVVARVLSEKLTTRLGQSVIVENRPGANGLIASQYVAQATGDGYTLLVANVGPTAVNPSLYKSLPYDPVKDFTPISMTTVFPIMLVTGADSSINSVADLIKKAKAEPGKLTFASAGPGSSNHLSGEMLNQMAGIKMVHIPYKGDAPALTDVMGGQVPVMFATTVSSGPLIKSGKVRALAVATAAGAKAFPNVPTLAQTVPGFDSSSWGGILGPKNMPRPVVERLNKEINAVLEMPEVKAKLEQQGAMVEGGTPEQFAKFIADETTKWARVVKSANVHVD
jgi:tripartite-type tricarboxylate transporter receptor subunit TctC